MKFNLADQREANQAFAHLVQLTGRKVYVDIKVWNSVRSIPQNNYLHLLLAAFGQHFGYTLQESKILYKQNSVEIYRYKKKGRHFWRSSADLDKRELTESIGNFRQFSAEQGLDLPLPTQTEYLRSIENEIERSNYR